MNKIQTKILLALLTAVAALPAFAQDVTIDGIEYIFHSSSEATVISGKNCSGDVIIPESISVDGKEYAVTTIHSAAFKENYNLTSITIPNSVTKIYSEAFSKCTHLTSVIIGESVAEIGKCAFYDCVSLTTLNVPDSVTTIGEQAFNSCDNLTTVTLGSSVSLVGGCAFYYTYNILNIICLAQEPPAIGYVSVEYDDDHIPINWGMVDKPPFASSVFWYSNLYVPAESIEAYKEKSVWNEFVHIKPITLNEVDEIAEPEDSFSISGNTISVNENAGTLINIFSIDGMLLHESDNGPVSIELPSGIYILKIGNKTTRIKI